MARIRSIKPDFFTSETIAALPLSARLTFIGLWTYVDDNGVGIDNELLITAAIWPLETDPSATVARTREDLARLSGIGVVTRYRDSRKRYLHVTSWAEHQKVDHPGKPRYPLPTDPGVLSALTSENAETADPLANGSRDPRDGLAPEQGAGSREQGKKSPSSAAPKIKPGSDEDPDFTAFWDAYPKKVDKGHARNMWRSAVTAKKAEPKDVITGAERFAAYCRARGVEKKYIPNPGSWLNGERWGDDTDDGAGVLEYPNSPWEN